MVFIIKFRQCNLNRWILNTCFETSCKSVFYSVFLVRKEVISMQFIVLLCNVLFFATCFGVDGNVLSSSTEGRGEKFRFTPNMCPTSRTTLYERVTDVGNSCARNGISRETASKLENARTVQQMRGSFQKYCQAQSIVRQCLAETTTHITEMCQNETFTKTFKIYRETIETILDFGCREDGEKFSSLWYGIFEFATSQETAKQATMCSDRYELILKELERSNIDISSKLYILHTEIIAFSECLYRIEISQSYKDDLKPFLGEIINKMKCIHPQDGALIPCGTIDVNLVSTPNVCDLKTIGTEMSLYDVLEKGSGSCVMSILDYEDTVDNNKVRQRVGFVCANELYLPYCYNNSRIVSEVCLNDTQRNEFKFLGDFIKSALEVACAEDRTRLSDIMLEVYRLNKTGHGHAVWDCVDLAKSTRKQFDDRRTYSKNMRFYHELEAFKGCLINKFVGDQTSVDAATSLIGEMLGMVKCVHPEQGTAVLCETLVNTA